MSIRVVIADDHPLVRSGLRFTIERSGANIEIVGEASDGLAVLKLAQQTAVDVFILDITMPNLNGILATRELCRLFPAAKVIILSLHDTQEMVERALEAGARGYLTKEMAPHNVVEAVTAVQAGRYYLCPSITHFALARSPTPALLTPQEQKVLQLIAEGRSTKEIAALLGRSSNTIHVHRNRLMAKLKIHKQADLVRYAVKAGLAKL